MENNITVWAFNQAEGEDVKARLCESIRAGVSRFGWSYKDEHNLKLKDNWTEHHPKQLFLLSVKPGDWIVHINTPKWGQCIAMKVVSSYDFDEGIPCDGGTDFRHCFQIDTDSITEFERNDPNVLPGVNLTPRQRYQRVYAVEEFLQSIKNLRVNAVTLNEGDFKEEFHLRQRTNTYLGEISKLIHETHKSKKLERFLAKVFEKVPGVVNVEMHGYGGGADHGADIIVTIHTPLGHLELERKIVVQVKSYSGDHLDLSAVDQVAEGVKKFDAAAGMIVTTAKESEALEKAISQRYNEIGVPIDLLAADDVARFVIKHAPELLFELQGIA